MATKSNDPHGSGEFRSGAVAGTALLEGVTFARKAVQYADVDGLAMFEGDIVLGSVQSLRDEVQWKAAEAASGVQSSVGISGQQFRWPNATVPYDIDPALPTQQRVTDAIAHWEANTRIRFVLRTPANAAQFQDFVHFQPGGGCSSMVGRRGGQQNITLGAGCTTGNAIHEIGHAVGLWHEQSREDRDTFVEIVWANIDPAMQHNFDQHIADGDDLGAYEYGSIMHYPATAFSINGQATINARQPLPAGVAMGQRTGLSQGDIAGVHTMYPAAPTAKEVPKDPLTETLKEPVKDPIRDTIKEIRKDPIHDTLKEVRKDPIQDTAKEPRKDPIHDTIKEVRKDPIHDTAKEPRKDPIHDTFKEVRKDPVRETLKEPVFDPLGAAGMQPPPGPADSPFILATPSRAGGGLEDAVGAAMAQMQQLTDALATLEQQQAELLAAYDATVHELDQLQGGQG